MCHAAVVVHRPLVHSLTQQVPASVPLRAVPMQQARQRVQEATHGTARAD